MKTIPALAPEVEFLKGIPERCFKRYPALRIVRDMLKRGQMKETVPVSAFMLTSVKVNVSDKKWAQIQATAHKIQRQIDAEKNHLPAKQFPPALRESRTT